ncbi:hypothetical protein HRI_005104700 [Hibiscus trionum]|uniref:Tyrosinase copper-binding domain-containing protein n=1 Tax=Hibiscus trionum TaxID=183268 RepID=A0A9W7JII4_HIBTR|nr:hypothetical protein HRI_005104700 [Hibiscus trionum]
MASTLISPSALLISPTLKKKQPFSFASKRVVFCRANNGFDRRDMLLGLGSLYGATSLVGDPFALASPIAPDFSRPCSDAILPGNHVPCCPPESTKIIDFELPEVRKIRHRPAAHLVDCDYLIKFELAMERMRALPKDDPRSFFQQARVHCAYCNEAYFQKEPPRDEPDQKLKVHFSWLFFPFHRMYLYFYEKILGELIGEPDFAMPFWNWDSPCGMTMPGIYLDPASPLYDPNRNVEHQHVLVDLSDGKKSKTKSTERGTTYELSRTGQIKNNLNVMYNEMVSGSKKATWFYGQKYRAGCNSKDDGQCKPEPGGGLVENGSHIAIHKFVGAKKPPYNEDMGNFYSAGRDPLFYAHHGNVDRMWSIRKALPGWRQEFHYRVDRDWYNSEFYFYDEKRNLVRAKVWQFLDTERLGYAYQNVDIPWLRSRPTPRRLRGGQGKAKVAETIDIRNAFPLVLDNLVRIKVPRPKRSMTKPVEGYKDEDEDEEVLVIQNIQVDRNASVKFDVNINDLDDETPARPEDSEFAGSFSTIPHGIDHPDSKINTSLTLPISELLKDLGIEDEDYIEVSLVPKEGKGLVSIGNIKIDKC